MLTTHLPLLFVLLLGSVTTSGQFHQIRCISFRLSESDRPRVDDCLAAINMLPSGKYELDGTRLHKPLHLRLPQSVRERQFYLPAIFRAGTCEVNVVARGTRRYDKPSKADLPKPASAMYNIFWPAVRANATKMVDRCLKPIPKEDGAILYSKVMLEQYSFNYEIQIIDSNPGMPGDGWLVDKNNGYNYNVYEPGGSASGHGTKGYWQNYDDPTFSSNNSSESD